MNARDKGQKEHVRVHYPSSMAVPSAKLLSQYAQPPYNGHHQQGGSQHLCHKPKDKWFGVLATKFTSGPTTAFMVRLARSAPSYPSGSIRKKQFFCHVSCYDRAQNDSRVNVGHVYSTKQAAGSYFNPYKGDGANATKARPGLPSVFASTTTEPVASTTTMNEILTT